MGEHLLCMRECPYDATQLDEMVEAVCPRKETIRVAGNNFPDGDEVPAAETGREAHPLCVRLPPGEHHTGQNHEAISADDAA